MSIIRNTFGDQYNGKIEIKWSVPHVAVRTTSKFNDLKTINFKVPRKITVLKKEGTSWPKRIRIAWKTGVTVTIYNPLNCKFEKCNTCDNKKCKDCIIIGTGNKIIITPKDENTTRFSFKIGIKKATSPHPPITDPKTTVSIGEPP